MRFYLNSVEVTPLNYESIGISDSKESLEVKTELTTDTLEFVNEGKDVILAWLQQYGYFQGIPFVVMLDNGFTLDYFIDTYEGLRIQDDKIIAKVVKERSNTEFFRQVDSYSFDLLASLGVQFTTIDVPYMIRQRDIGIQVILIGIATYQVATAIIDAISNIAKAGAAVTSGVTGVVYSSLLILLELTKITLLLIALANLIKTIVDILFPPIEYYVACSFKELIVKGLGYFGYTLNSSLVDELANYHFQGIPINDQGTSFFDSLFPAFAKSFTKGYPTATDTYAGMVEDFTSLGGFIRMIARVFNARVQVVGTTVRIERRDKKYNTTTGVSTALTIQDLRVTEYQANTNEVWQRALLKYPIDPNDVYTQDDFDNSVVEYATQNNNLLSLQRNLVKGVKYIDMPFAKVKRRKDLNYLESFMKLEFGGKLGEAFAQFASFLQTGVVFPLADLILNPPKRVGVAVYSDHFYTIPKMLYLVGDKQPENFNDFIGADAIWKKYHEIDFIGNNSFFIYSGEKSEINNEMFVNLLNSDFAEINGEVCEIINLEYYENDRTAIITYKKPENYATTVKLTKIT